MRRQYRKIEHVISANGDRLFLMDGGAVFFDNRDIFKDVDFFDKHNMILILRIVFECKLSAFTWGPILDNKREVGVFFYWENQ